jgi:hypothetical protein
MYGLPQAGLLSQRRLIAHLAAHDYIQDSTVSCLFRHAKRGTVFTLVVDDFAVKYKTKADADHFLDMLRLLYEITIDWRGSKYLGYTIEWDDVAHTVSLSMPNCIPKLLARFRPDEVLRGAASPAVTHRPITAHNFSSPSTTTAPPWILRVSCACRKLSAQCCSVHEQSTTRCSRLSTTSRPIKRAQLRASWQEPRGCYSTLRHIQPIS